MSESTGAVERRDAEQAVDYLRLNITFKNGSGVSSICRKSILVAPGARANLVFEDTNGQVHVFNLCEIVSVVIMTLEPEHAP